MKITFRLAVALVAAACAIPALAAGNTATGNLAVSATVKASCSVATGNALSFGTYDPSAPVVTITSAIAFKCTKSTSWEVTLSKGGSPGLGASGTRAMVNAGNTEYLGYDLFIDGGATKVWGDTAGGGNTVSGSGIPAGPGGTIPVTGVIPVGQYVTPQAYSDTVVITVNY
jgi:spore coat protein U-like protein